MKFVIKFGSSCWISRNGNIALVVIFILCISRSRKNFGSGDGGRNKGRQDTGQNFHGKNNNEGKGFDRRQSLPRRNIEKDKPQPLLEGAVTWLVCCFCLTVIKFIC